MRLMACNCLNVRIHSLGKAQDVTDVGDLQLSEEANNDPFFTYQLQDVQLDLGGVTVSQKLLSTVRDVEKWKITSCVQCDMDVCASHENTPDRVVINANIVTDHDCVKQKMEMENYSPLFKLLLPEINDNFIQNNKGIDFQKGILDRTIDSVQSQVSKFLNYECCSMRERIRLHAEREQATYTELLHKVRKEKQAMVYLLLISKKIDPTLEPSTADSPLNSPDATVNKDNDSAFDRSEISDTSEGDKNQKNPRTLRRAVSNPVGSRNKAKRQLRHAPRSIDVGGVFDMEEFDDKELEYDSGDFTDGSDNNSDEVINEKSQISFPSSLPMSIPAFTNLNRYMVAEEDDEPIQHLTDPEQIAASFRAVANSVCDGTEMFGELPRRRLNTGELLAYRPF
ncbi:uncharacterized protein LOC129219331 isoform X2 [Uloborus diversus]|uniref:uncharacterized protein LOC129219331 isoform X2 n=1 Tax=Uloborus diversus TaxID=327109 RepID=UPI002409C69C|nr:uncharacterized protein LOC129219331 isoform X2 [Uloborus diversus]